MRNAVDRTGTGRVQGGSFRYYAEREATRIGLGGWVRNEPDGSVAAHVEGDPGAVDGFVRWCHEGPRLARVERVDVRCSDDEGRTSFGVR